MQLSAFILAILWKKMYFSSLVDTKITQNWAIQKFLGSSEMYIAISKNIKNRISYGKFNFDSSFLWFNSHTDRKDTWWFRYILRFAFQGLPLNHSSKFVTLLNLFIFPLEHCSSSQLWFYWTQDSSQREMNKHLVATCFMYLPT